MTNREIVDKYIDDGLIRRCVECQFAKMKDRHFENDFFQDLILILLNYDPVKLNDAETNNHMNALITRIIINNVWSKTSPFYKDYYKFQNKTRELTPDDNEIPDAN